MQRNAWVLAAGFILMLTSVAADHSAPPPVAITGTWSGTVKAKSIHSDDDGVSGSAKIRSEALPATFTFTQSGSELTCTLAVITDDGTFTGNLSGHIGNNTFWLEGTGADIDLIDPPEALFIAGHVASNGKKIAGQGIAIGGGVTEVLFSLKPAAASVILSPSAAAPETPRPESRDEEPFNIAGAAKGKFYSFTTGKKSASYKSDFTGVLTPSTETQSSVSATATLKGPDGVTLNFNLSSLGHDYDNYIALTGASGANRLVLFGKTGKDSASTVFLLFTPDGEAEGKLLIKAQK